MIYLDNAATCLPKAPGVGNAMKDAIEVMANSGRGGYASAMKTSDMIYSVRSSAARMFSAPDAERVVFTPGATQSINIAVKSMVARGRRIVVSAYEHNAVMRALRLFGAVPIVAHSSPFDKDGALSAYERALASGADGAVVTHVSNVFGFALPVEEIAALCAKRHVPLLIDAAQSAGIYRLDYTAIGADFLAVPGHKGLYGPEGIGLLLCPDTALPITAGGTGSNSASYDMPDFLPDRLEAGTMNIPGIAGLGAGLSFVEKHGEQTLLGHDRQLITYAAEKLRAVNGVTVYLPPDEPPDSGVLSFNVGDKSSTVVGMALEKDGFAVRTGLHCSPLAHRSAGTMQLGTVRISVSYFNRKSDIDALADALSRLEL